MARERFGNLPPPGTESPMDIEARLVIARARLAPVEIVVPTVGSGRKCAQDGILRPLLKRKCDGMHGGDDDDDGLDRLVDDSDDVCGRVVGGVCAPPPEGCPGNCAVRYDDVLERVVGGVVRWEDRKSRRSRRCLSDSEVESQIIAGTHPLLDGRHGPSSLDNVHGCVRGLITPLGEVHREDGPGGWVEQEGTPRSGERVVLCSAFLCDVSHKHPADYGNTHDSDPPAPDSEHLDVYRRGVLCRTSSCHRVCDACGLMFQTRQMLSLCTGCHAMTPYIRAGMMDDGDRILEERYLDTAKYCDIECQAAHWPAHREVCPRHDVTMHRAASGVLGVQARPYGRLLADGGRIPFLARAILSQPGARFGWGNT